MLTVSVFVTVISFMEPVGQLTVVVAGVLELFAVFVSVTFGSDSETDAVLVIVACEQDVTVGML